jgi:hypothetical protein
MRQVAGNREAAAARGAAAREHLRVNHSPERAAAFVRERLGYWRDRRDAGWVPASYVAPPGPQALLAANQWFVEGAHFPPAHRSGSPVGRLIQRVVRRLLRAPLGRQLQFNANIIQVVNELAAEHRDVRGVNDPPAR